MSNLSGSQDRHRATEIVGDDNAYAADRFTEVMQAQCRDNDRPSEQADDLIGTAAFDSIDLLGGSDRFEGLAGDDSISGGAGDDSLFGGDGADVMDGGTGSNLLYGEAGDDRLLFTLGAPPD